MSSRHRRRGSLAVHGPDAGDAMGLSKTLTWKEIPDWQRDNEYILTGYRRVQNSWTGCFASVFGYLHNETINIHSHLIGAMVFVFLIATFQSRYISSHPSASWMDTAVFAIFLFSAVFCLTSSAFYHMSSCHSPKVSARCHLFDYTGIIVLIVGSFYPCMYYGFFYETYIRIFYLSLITAFGVGAAYVVLNPEYAKPTHRGARTKIFIGLGLCAFGPISHLFFSGSEGFARLCSQLGFGWVMVSGALYIVGALLYANRIPERLMPGKYDYFFASHQIFHVHVVLAALAHYIGILTAFSHRHSKV